MTDCALCGVPVAAGETYCCPGCRLVDETVATSDTPEQEGATEPAVGAVTYCAIDGMHCTTCETFLGARGRGIDGIYDVSASYATDTARVRYDPDEIDRDAIPAALSGYGYTVRERAAQSRTENTDPVLTALVGGGLFGMMVMVWYAVVLYPSYLGFEPVVEFGGFTGAFLAANLWVFTTVVLGTTGWSLLRGAAVSLWTRQPNTDLLVALAAVGAYLYSTLAMVLGRADLYFDVTVMIVLIVAVGRYYEGRLKRQVIGSLDAGVASMAGDVELVDGTRVSIEELAGGEHVRVRVGEAIPVDGTVVEGTGTIDTAVVTGEAMPEPVGPGAAVPGGGVVRSGPLVVKLDASLASTQTRLLESTWDIQSDTPGLQRLADRLATVFVPTVLVVAIGVVAWTLLTGGAGNQALLRGLTVLIVACPCALGVATPLAVAAGIKDAFGRGIVVVSSAVFEAAPAIDTVVLDKTGTLTEGGLAVRGVYGADVSAVVERAVALESRVAHPIAEAITSYARGRGIRADGGVVTETDRGVAGTVADETVVVGHPSLIEQEALSIESALVDRIEAIEAAGDRPVVVAWAGTVHGVIAIGERERADTEAALDALAADHDVIVVTGDDGPGADRFREHPAVAAVFAGVPPEGKVATIERLRGTGRVAMVGDGTNDAPALAAADLGIAIAEGTAVAGDAADVVLRGEDIDRVVDLFGVVGGTNRRIRENLGWAFVYNGLAIPLAVAGVLNPFFAALAMATSSSLVVANTKREIRLR